MKVCDEAQTESLKRHFIDRLLSALQNQILSRKDALVSSHVPSIQLVRVAFAKRPTRYCSLDANLCRLRDPDHWDLYFVQVPGSGLYRFG